MDLSEGIKLSCNSQPRERCLREGRGVGTCVAGGTECLLGAAFSPLAVLLWC